MKRFVNAREAIVTEAIDGLLASSHGDIARLDGYPHIKVVVRNDWDKRKVAVISGGGAGHEPAHAGFVGPGVLTGAVCGEIFASPSVDAVLACILAVTGEPGCLLVVKNYTGDRLNFGLAAEKAKRLGIAVELVVVADDVALPGAARPRGIAGTLFVHKVAGHLAESGHPLSTVKRAAEDAAASIRSLGVSFSTCTVPGQQPESRLGPRDAELGMGIHGEPGAAVIEAGTAHEIVGLMVDRLCRDERPAHCNYGMLVNNLGAVPPIEMGVIVNEVLGSVLGPRIELLFGPAPLMTSLDMNGFSLSLIELNAERREALLAPVGPRAWVPGVRMRAPRVLPLPRSAHAIAFQGSDDPVAAAVLRGVCRVLMDSEAELNRLDAKVGDGDTGSTFATAARSVLASLDAAQLPLAEPDRLCLAIGERLGTTMGGSSGVLLSILFTAAGAEMARTRRWAAALEAGVHAVRRYGGAAAGDRTMLDALLPAVAALERDGIVAAAEAAEHGAEATAAMTKAQAGRSSYVDATHLQGVRDPGAAAVAHGFRAAAKALERARVEESA